MPKITLTYGLTAGMFLMASLLASDALLDIGMHDTYFVVSYTHILTGLGILFLLFTLVTWGISKLARRLSPVLNWLHYGLTMICLLIIVVLIYKLNSNNFINGDYSVYEVFDKYDSQTTMTDWIGKTGFIFILSQLLFIVNIIRAFVVKGKRY